MENLKFLYLQPSDDLIKMFGILDERFCNRRSYRAIVLHGIWRAPAYLIECQNVYLNTWNHLHHDCEKNMQCKFEMLFISSALYSNFVCFLFSNWIESSQPFSFIRFNIIFKIFLCSPVHKNYFHFSVPTWLRREKVNLLAWKFSEFTVRIRQKPHEYFFLPKTDFIFTNNLLLINITISQFNVIESTSRTWSLSSNNNQ